MNDVKVYTSDLQRVTAFMKHRIFAVLDRIDRNDRIDSFIAFFAILYSKHRKKRFYCNYLQI